MDRQQFKIIPGFDGLYQISDQYNVRAVKYRTVNGRKRRLIKNIKPFKKDGQAYVILYYPFTEELREYCVDKLKAIAFDEWD